MDLRYIEKTSKCTRNMETFLENIIFVNPGSKMLRIVEHVGTEVFGSVEVDILKLCSFQTLKIKL